MDGEIVARAIYAEAAGLVPGKPLLAALAALAPAGKRLLPLGARRRVSGCFPSPLAPGRSKRSNTAAVVAPVQSAEGLLWVHGYVLTDLSDGKMKIRMDVVRLPGSLEMIRLRRALVKEVIVGARTRLRDPRGKPIRRRRWSRMPKWRSWARRREDGSTPRRDAHPAGRATEVGRKRRLPSLPNLWEGAKAQGHVRELCACSPNCWHRAMVSCRHASLGPGQRSTPFGHGW